MSLIITQSNQKKKQKTETKKNTEREAKSKA